MYNPILQRDINEALRKKASALATVCRQEVINNTEEARLFLKGVKTFAGMTDEEWDKIKNLSVSEVAKKYDGKDSAAVRCMLVKAHGAFKAVNDVILGKPAENQYIIGKNHKDTELNKSFHNERLTNMGVAVRLVQETSDLLNGNQFDMGYEAAYAMRDARGAQEMKVIDIFGRLFLKEAIGGGEPEIVNMGQMKDERIGYRKFHIGVGIDDYDNISSLLQLNDYLNGMRAGSAHTKSIVAYKELFTINSNTLDQALVEEFDKTATTNKDEGWKQVANAVVTLNKAAYALTSKLSGVDQDQPQKNKAGKEQQEAFTPFSFNAPLLVYYNPQHTEFIGRVQRMIRGDDGINPQFEHPFVFIPSFMASPTGGYSVSDANALDGFGIQGKLKISGTQNKKGVHLVYPGFKNQMGIFSDLAFERDRRGSVQQTVVVAHERYNAKKNDLQTARVYLT